MSESVLASVRQLTAALCRLAPPARAALGRLVPYGDGAAEVNLERTRSLAAQMTVAQVRSVAVRAH